MKIQHTLGQSPKTKCGCPNRRGIENGHNTSPEKRVLHNEVKCRLSSCKLKSKSLFIGMSHVIYVVFSSAIHIVMCNIFYFTHTQKIPFFIRQSTKCDTICHGTLDTSTSNTQRATNWLKPEIISVLFFFELIMLTWVLMSCPFANRRWRGGKDHQHSSALSYHFAMLYIKFFLLLKSLVQIRWQSLCVNVSAEMLELHKRN